MNREQLAMKKTKDTKEKKLFVVFLAFVVNLFLFTSCPNINTPHVDNELARQGKGSFTLQLAETTARTVLPVAPILSDFAVFELIFTATPAGNGEDHSVSFAYGGSATLPTVILVAGTYNITVNAYLGGTTAAPTNLAAKGILNNAVINPGDNRSDNITLRALFDEGQGTFNWGVNITAANVTTATMSIVGITSGASTFTDVNLLTTPNGSPGLNSGIYNVTFRLTRTTVTSGQPDRTEESFWYEMLYVYQSLTSTMPVLAFDNASFHRENYVVTFIHNDGSHVFTSTPIGTGYQSVLHAGVIGTAGSLDSLASPGYRFDGWYESPTFAGTAWNLATAPILKDMTLHAKWSPNQITITLIDVDNIPAALGLTFAPVVTPPITLSRSGAGGNQVTQDITITGTYNSISWSIQGKGIYAPGQSGAQNITGTASPINLDANNLVYNSLGGHTVQLDITVGTTQYRTSFRFNIVE